MTPRRCPALSVPLHTWQLWASGAHRMAPVVQDWKLFTRAPSVWMPGLSSTPVWLVTGSFPAGPEDCHLLIITVYMLPAQPEPIQLPYSIALLFHYYHITATIFCLVKQIWGQSSPTKKIVNMQNNLMHVINNKSYRSQATILFPKCQY